jgi:ketosteroid isomerase-like protein
MAIRTNPSYATAHENLGDVYARLASQAYNKALQLDTDNSAVPPKLAIIREVFKPNLSNPKPAPASAAKPAPAATPTPAPAPAVPTPAPQAATPVPAPAVVAATTPPPVMPKAPAKDSSSKDAADVQAAVESWAKAWSNKNMAGYFGAYSKAFDPPGKQSRSAWEQDRRDRIVGKSTIIVKLENLTVKVSGNQAVVKFRQGYRADALSVSSRKTLDMVKTGDQWQIVKESTGN